MLELHLWLTLAHAGTCMHSQLLSKSVAELFDPNRLKAIRKASPFPCHDIQGGGLFPPRGEHEDHSLVRVSQTRLCFCLHGRLFESTKVSYEPSRGARSAAHSAVLPTPRR